MGYTRRLKKRASSYWWSRIANRTPKVFCISMQRTGTTSVGRFFKDHGFVWAGWRACEKNGWSDAWYDGDYESIFSSEQFRQSNAFEDSPWWHPGFYKILFHRFPDSKFILFERDPEAWFQSMLSHSGGNVIGRSKGHCKIYRRELEYFELAETVDFNEKVENSRDTSKTMKLTGFANHYKDIYQLHSIEVKEFFQRHASDALHIGNLEDPDKWIKLGEFLGIEVTNGYNVHANRSA